MDDITDRKLRAALQDASEQAARGERPNTVAVAAALRTRAAGPEDPLTSLVAALECYPIDTASCNGNGGLDELPLWVRALAYAPRPLVAARFADLLWSARYGATPHEWAQRAIDAYLAAVYDQFGHVLEISEGLQRAHDITVQIDDHPRRAAVVAALVGLANRSMESEDRSSGVALSIIEFLADRPSADRPSDLHSLLERARDRYGSDPWLLESTLDIKARLVEPIEREQLHVAQVEAFSRLARGSEGLLRYAHYEHAIELATRHDLPALADALRSEAERSPDPRDDFFGHIVADDTLIDALARFGVCLPPEVDDTNVHDAECRRLSFFGTLAVDLLARIQHRYGAVSAAGPWFECRLIDDSAAARIADAIRYFESGYFHPSVSVLGAELEQIIRSIASAAGATFDEGREISDVLSALDGSLYEPSRRYLHALLAKTTGVVTAERTALLVHAACHLRLLEPVDYTGTVRAIV